MYLALKCILMSCLVVGVKPNDPRTMTSPLSEANTMSAQVPEPTTLTTASTPEATTTNTTDPTPEAITTMTAPAPQTNTTTAHVTEVTAITTSTPASEATTMTAPVPEATNATTAPAPEATTTTATVPEATGTPGTTVSITTTITATTTKGPCTPNPCVGNGICEERYGADFVCTCRPGLVYSFSSGCMPAKVFPGNFTLNEDFDEKMLDTTSESFKNTAEKIQIQLHAALQGDTGYINSTVLSLKSGSIVAEVQNFYEVSSNATTVSVANLINNKINGSFIEKSVCDIGYCDVDTTTCKGDGIAVCTCSDGYIKSNFTSQSCIYCPYGEKSVNSEYCEKCGFGFSGFNCTDPSLLVVVVVSCLLGSLLIIFIVALIVVSIRKQKVITSQPQVFQQDFSNVEMHKPVGVPRIPRVNPVSDWQPANLEVINSGSTEELMIKNKREDKSHYSNYNDDSDDGRYSNCNPPVYGGVRVMENGSRGNQNQYHRQDEDRMRRY